jgi:LmbE family N-acetylglucosaminyl deacetylase
LHGTRRALVVAPHPDDEVIGAAGLIQALTVRGATVVVAIVSDGAASHPGSRRWPRTRLVAARRRESRRALRRLGVCAGEVRMLGLPDGRLDAHEGTARRRLRRIVARWRPDLIVGPAAEDAHPDHRAVARSLDAVAPAVRRLAYRVWPVRGRRRTASGLLRVRGGAPAKRSLIALHRTQLGAIRDDPAGFAIAAHELRAFAHPLERFATVVR